MESRNYTQIARFVLLGFSDDPDLQPLLFGIFLSMYLATVLGNMLIILATVSDSRLHTPMYFFLSNLSFVDISFTSTTVPNMLMNIQTQSKVMTYEGCITQVYFFVLLVMLDIFLLTVMSYDRYVAICHPLHYRVIMNPQLCVLLVLACWILSVLNALLHSLMVLRLTFCTGLEIPHFFCELNQIVHSACSDTFHNDVVTYVSTVLLGGGPLAGILHSYFKIVSSIHAISSAQGRYKAFSTCASHLSVVSLFYGTSLGVYLSSAVAQNSYSTATASVMYSVVTPMLNPFIYSLRNKDIKNGLKILFKSATRRQSVDTPTCQINALCAVSGTFRSTSLLKHKPARSSEMNESPDNLKPVFKVFEQFKEGKNKQISETFTQMFIKSKQLHNPFNNKIN
ncbi:olfactory receptor 7A10-like [Heterocephalus glaber]|uniref:Olfactory receptor n=1 Tax=Heterocephalus glaber TaxID=10181 RepID=A0AAX6Q162_HETGA|nr:olfactory receptor 7A10-like [Heterocephalus glaber]